MKGIKLLSALSTKSDVLPHAVRTEGVSPEYGSSVPYATPPVVSLCFRVPLAQIVG
jgi:hypothetical protein